MSSSDNEMRTMCIFYGHGSTAATELKVCSTSQALHKTNANIVEMLQGYSSAVDIQGA